MAQLLLPGENIPHPSISTNTAQGSSLCFSTHVPNISRVSLPKRLRQMQHLFVVCLSKLHSGKCSQRAKSAREWCLCLLHTLGQFSPQRELFLSTMSNQLHPACLSNILFLFFIFCSLLIKTNFQASQPFGIPPHRFQPKLEIFTNIHLFMTLGCRIIIVSILSFQHVTLKTGKPRIRWYPLTFGGTMRESMQETEKF